MCARSGRPSIPPEEQLDYNLLVRRFVDGRYGVASDDVHEESASDCGTRKWLQSVSSAFESRRNGGVYYRTSTSRLMGP